MSKDGVFLSIDTDLITIEEDIATRSVNITIASDDVTKRADYQLVVSEEQDTDSHNLETAATNTHLTTYEIKVSVCTPQYSQRDNQEI